jgi:hypothetical protein
MRSAKTLLVLAGLAIVIAVAAFWYRPQAGSDIAGSGESVLPQLAEQAASIQEIILVQSGESVSLRRDGEQWHLQEKGNYPADPAKVRALVLGLADLRRVEPKTATPERYPELGLGDPAAEGSAAVGVTLHDDQGGTLAELILGDRQVSRSDPARSEIYLRVPGEAQTWLVEGVLPELGDSVSWVDDTLMKLDRSRIRSVTVRHADGEELRVARGSKEATDFELLDQPEGREVDSQFAVSAVANAFADFSFADVVPAAEVTFPEQPELSARLETFDGLQVEAEAMRQEDDRWLLRLRASGSPEAGAATPDVISEANAETPAGDADSGGEKPAGDGDPGGDSPADAPGDVAAEAKALEEAWQGWLYEPSAEWVSRVNQRTVDLLKAETSESTGGG